MGFLVENLDLGDEGCLNYKNHNVFELSNLALKPVYDFLGVFLAEYLDLGGEG